LWVYKSKSPLEDHVQAGNILTFFKLLGLINKYRNKLYNLFLATPSSKSKVYDEDASAGSGDPLSPKSSVPKSRKISGVPQLDRDMSSDYLLDGEMLGDGSGMHQSEHLTEYRKNKQVK
jgi:hypothetical protein